MQLEDMHAACQLNEDQLNYNGHVLRDAATENLIALSQEKRKIAQLRDYLSGLKVWFSFEWDWISSQKSCKPPWNLLDVVYNTRETIYKWPLSHMHAATVHRCREKEFAR